MIAILPAAGNGTRLRPHTEIIPKVLLKVKGKPLIDYSLNLLKKIRVKEIFIIIHYKSKLVKKHVGKNFQGMKISYIDQRELKGLAHAIGTAEPYVNGKFIVMLGDEVYKNTNHKKIIPFFNENSADAVCGLIEIKDKELIKKNYSVELNGNGTIKRIIEKPKKITNNFLGVGTWLFKPDVFKFIKETKPSPLRNEIELADVIQKMIDSGKKVVPFVLGGSYVNVNKIEDVQTAELL